MKHAIVFRYDYAAIIWRRADTPHRPGRSAAWDLALTWTSRAPNRSRWPTAWDLAISGASRASYCSGRASSGYLAFARPSGSPDSSGWPTAGHLGWRSIAGADTADLLAAGEYSGAQARAPDLHSAEHLAEPWSADTSDCAAAARYGWEAGSAGELGCEGSLVGRDGLDRGDRTIRDSSWRADAIEGVIEYEEASASSAS
jgi:hypothetical protein